MHTIQPRALTNGEFLRIVEQEVFKPTGLPLNWQQELARRFALLAERRPPHDMTGDEMRARLGNR